MVITDKYIIGHIPKTGGDAIKAICAALFEAGLETNYEISSVFGSEKHKPFPKPLPGQVQVLGFRRLPAYALSCAHHGEYLGGYGAWSKEECFEKLRGDIELARITSRYQYIPKHFIRCEFLREDLFLFLKSIYGELFTDQHKRIVELCPTKTPMTYDHDYTNFFTQMDINYLYRKHPWWARWELARYGELVVL